NFAARSEADAQRFTGPFRFVENRVKADRMAYQGDTGRDRALRTYWWLFRGHRQELEDYASTRKKLIARSVVSKYSVFAFVDASFVCTASTYCFLSDDDAVLAVLQSSLHDAWSRRYGSTLRIDLRYIAGSCFKTFPLVRNAFLVRLGADYHA